MRKIGRAALCIRRFRNSTKTAPLPLPLAKLEAQLQRTLAGDGTIEPPHLGGLDLHRPTLQGPGLQCTPTPAAVSRQPGVNAASGKAQRLDHRFWALARLHSFHRTNPNLLQRLMVEARASRRFMPSIVSYVYLLMNILIIVQMAYGTHRTSKSTLP